MCYIDAESRYIWTINISYSRRAVSNVTCKLKTSPESSLEIDCRTMITNIN